ncbi:hypothetical protein C0584_01895 [Candidatus Parcubacteria bacterium]|nr:MAG: hypothetical protein C0584_01895 [Candidatus Parcubacteria bacterium]
MSKNKRKNRKWLKFLLFGGFFLYLFKKEEKEKGFTLADVEHNFLDFFNKEKKEIDELVHHKEDVVEYIEDSESIFKDYFIPSHSNNHHPKILRKRPLIAIFILALFLKFSLISYLFFIYPNNGQMSEDIQQGVLNMLNEERVSIGLEPLVLNDALIASATDKAEDMLANDYFAHESPDGRMPWDWVSRRDYPYIYIGENLGMSFTSAASVHKALMNSPSHKKNILNDKYSDVGVIVRRGMINGKETNILVQLFGSEKRVELIPNPVLAAAVKTEEKAKEDTTIIELDTGEKEELSAGSSEELVPEVLEEENVEKEEVIRNIEPDEKVLQLKEQLEREQEQEVIRQSSSSPLMLGDAAKTYIEKKTLEPDLEKELNYEKKYVVSTDIKDKYTIAARVSDFVNIILLAALAILSISLFINIIVRMRVQHKPVIVQTLILLIFLFGMYSTKLHFFEQLPNYITIF